MRSSHIWLWAYFSITEEYGFTMSGIFPKMNPF